MKKKRDSFTQPSTYARLKDTEIEQLTIERIDRFDSFGIPVSFYYELKQVQAGKVAKHRFSSQAAADEYIKQYRRLQRNHAL